MTSLRLHRSRASRLWRCGRCTFATSSSLGAPSLLAKFRTDMKEALKAKDKSRLNVLRGVLTETSTFEKQSQAVMNDKQLFKLLQKRMRTSRGVAEEFQAAGRGDLTAKEIEQAGILQEYIDSFDTASAAEVAAAISATIESLSSKGALPRKEKIRAMLFRPGGAFEDKIVDDSLVAMTIDRLTQKATPT